MNELPRYFDHPAAWAAMLAGVFLVAGCTQSGNASPADATHTAKAATVNDLAPMESDVAHAHANADTTTPDAEPTKAVASAASPHATATDAVTATPREQSAASAPPVVPMRAFARSLINGAHGAGYQMPTQLTLPAIWLFAPDGKLVAQVTSAAELQALSKPWPASEPSQMPYSILVEAWRSAGGSALPQAASGQGIAILMDQDGSTCNKPNCQALQKGLRDLQQAPWEAMTYTAHWQDEGE